MKLDMLIKNAFVYNTFLQQFEKKDVAVQHGKFVEVADCIDQDASTLLDAKNQYMVPGLIDIHMHIESSMTIPTRFSSAVLPHGVTTIVADPHEIANVFGLSGIQAYLSSATTLDIFYGIPSSVPSTNPTLETTGGSITCKEVEELLALDKILCLGEVMNFHDLCYEEDSLNAKIVRLCQKLRPRMPIEGHCPKISGKELALFIAKGVSADHTHQTPSSIVEKIKNGMFLEIQEKSMSQENIDTLMKHNFYEYFALVTDDVMADHLRSAHLNKLVKLAVERNMPIEKAIYCATYTPARRMHLEDRGVIAPGKLADFFFVDNLEAFNISDVYKNGTLVVKEHILQIEEKLEQFPKEFYQSIHCKEAKTGDFIISVQGEKALCNIMEIQPHATFTKRVQEYISIKDGVLDIFEKGYAMLTVFERYGKNGNQAHAIIKHAISKQGAIATSWAHDHHNVMVMGTNTSDMVLAQRKLLEMQGGYVVVENGQISAIANLEIGGIVSAQPIDVLGKQLRDVRAAMRRLGYVHDNEIMSFSTLSLPVSPELKITDIGMLDVKTQKIIPLMEDIQ